MQKYLLSCVPISSLKYVNKGLITKLQKIGLHTVQDLLLHFPIRYENHSDPCKIGNLLPGTCKTIKGKILNCKVTSANRKMLSCTISDGSGTLTIRFFYFNTAMKKSLSIGRYITVHGKVKKGKYGIEIFHPKFLLQKKYDTTFLQKTLTPIYPTTKGIKQKIFRNLTDQALCLLNNSIITEFFPDELIKNMMSLSEAIRTLHRPPISIYIPDLNNRRHPAQKRLIIEELLAHHLCALFLRKSMRCCHAYSLSIDNRLKDKFLSLLPFKPTEAQKRVIEEIENDMLLSVPMMRLVQGDVGSGKTLVAALAALCAISHGKQAALMAPTELLAEQHAENFRRWFNPLGFEVIWLSSKQRGKMRCSQQLAIASGKVHMIVGTHAIFQEKIKFHDLALVAIDEQHRFGVHQRFALWKKGFQKGFFPHQLIMTATPIPRTLAMITYANLDSSIINELPPGRKPVITVTIPNTRRGDIINRIRYACTTGSRQAYWICTLIEKSSMLGAQAAKDTWKELKKALPELNIGLLHGRMEYTEKKEVIQQFRQNQLHVLVATTVVEVGIDVPNASLMIIENPERLGLAQLHQLRGRIGRSIMTSYCVLVYKTPLSKNVQKRIQILRHSNDGFMIAQKDLEIRGPGDWLSTRQTGHVEFKIVNILRDQSLIPKIERIAHHMYKYYPDQATEIMERWIQGFQQFSLTFSKSMSNCINNK